jgi:hypothetical protein
MKSKKFILDQIKEIMLDKGHSEADANKYVDEVKGNTVYELLVLKKEIKESPVEEQEDTEPPSFFDRLRGVRRYEE